MNGHDDRFCPYIWKDSTRKDVVKQSRQKFHEMFLPTFNISAKILSCPKALPVFSFRIANRTSSVLISWSSLSMYKGDSFTCCSFSESCTVNFFKVIYPLCFRYRVIQGLSWSHASASPYLFPKCTRLSNDA